jgi:hypothetical protein
MPRWRTHIRRARSLLEGRWRVIGGVLLAVTIALPAAVYFWPREPNKLEDVIRQLGFLPITPPTNLRAPGTLYVVDGTGRISSALCEVPVDRLKGVLHESPTETRDAQLLRKASFNLDASIEKTLKDKLSGDLIESVNFSLEDVSVQEVSIANLRDINSDLQKNAACADSIGEYLKAGEHVCQGQQVLKATARYAIRTRRAVEGAAAAKLTEAVHATIDPKASVDGSTVTAGVGLFYGMRLAPLCMALPGQSLQRPPLSLLARVYNLLGI